MTISSVQSGTQPSQPGFFRVWLMFIPGVPPIGEAFDEFCNQLNLQPWLVRTIYILCESLFFLVIYSLCEFDYILNEYSINLSYKNAGFINSLFVFFIVIVLHTILISPLQAITCKLVNWLKG